MDAVRPMTDPERTCDPLTATSPRCVAAGWIRAWLPCAVPAVFPRPPRPGSHRFPARAADGASGTHPPHHGSHQGYPVHLDRAQITFYDPAIHALFIIDPTDGISWTRAAIRCRTCTPATWWRWMRSAARATWKPVLLHPHFRILSNQRLPEAPLIGFDRLSTDFYDSQWVAIEGIVRSVRRPQAVTYYAGHAASSSANLIVTLASGQDLMDVITLDPQGGDHSNLIDARIRLRAACGTRFNQRKQIIGVHLYMPDISYVQVLEPAPADPFSLPLKRDLRRDAGQPA